MTYRAEYRTAFCAVAALFCLAAVAERQPIDRYQSIIDRQMFGQPPPNFDPSIPPSHVQRGGGDDEKVLTQEQQTIKSAIHFSAINVTPAGDIAVGFTDNSDSKLPIHYYLKVGEERNGWRVLEADPIKAKMKIAKGDVEVELDLGANSANGGGSTSRIGAMVAANRRAGLSGGGVGRPSVGSGQLSSGMMTGASLRERRALKAQARQEELAKEKELEAKREQERIAKEKAEREEKEQRDAEREEQRRELQLLKDAFIAQREERARKEREAEQQSENAEDNN